MEEKCQYTRRALRKENYRFYVKDPLAKAVPEIHLTTKYQNSQSIDVLPLPEPKPGCILLF